MKIRQVGAEFYADGQTYMTKLIVAFRNFANAPKNVTNRKRLEMRSMCQQYEETLQHTAAECPISAKEQYIKRHDRVCAQLHFNICRETAVQLDNENCMSTYQS